MTHVTSSDVHDFDSQKRMFIKEIIQISLCLMSIRFDRENYTYLHVLALFTLYKTAVMLTFSLLPLRWILVSCYIISCPVTSSDKKTQFSLYYTSFLPESWPFPIKTVNKSFISFLSLILMIDIFFVKTLVLRCNMDDKATDDVTLTPFYFSVILQTICTLYISKHV